MRGDRTCKFKGVDRTYRFRGVGRKCRFKGITDNVYLTE